MSLPCGHKIPKAHKGKITHFSQGFFGRFYYVKDEDNIFYCKECADEEGDYVEEEKE